MVLHLIMSVEFRVCFHRVQTPQDACRPRRRATSPNRRWRRSPQQTSTLCRSAPSRTAPHRCPLISSSGETSCILTFQIMPSLFASHSQALGHCTRHFPQNRRNDGRCQIVNTTRRSAEFVKWLSIHTEHYPKRSISHQCRYTSRLIPRSVRQATHTVA